MRKMKKNVRLKNIINGFNIFLLVMILISSANMVFAANNDYNFWNVAGDWYKQGETNTYLDDSVLSQIANIIEIVGTGVIAIATVVLGIRYILGSATQRADVKDNMITLLVACLFFFGWSNLRNILISGVTFTDNGVSNVDGTSKFNIFDPTSLSATLGNIFGIVLNVGKAVALIATVYIGFKYVLSGAEGKSQLKEKGIMYIIGIILIFSTFNIITFISKAVNQL